jgi:glycosyltransferase involved in cell wall biosynthesis
VKKKQHKTILFLVQLPPPLHGVSAINQALCKQEDLTGEAVRILLELRISDRTDQLRRFSLKKVFRIAGIWFRLLWLLSTRRITHVYFSIVPTLPGFYRDLLFVLLIKVFRKRPIYHPHLTGIPAKGRGILHRIYRFAFSNASIIHPSGEISRSEFDGLNLKNTRIFIRPNGIGEPLPLVTARTWQDLRIVYVSHLYRFKGLELLLDVFADLVKDGQEFYLDIVGEMADPEVVERLEEMVKDSRLADRVKWHGMLTGEEKDELLAVSDIFVFTSYQETFPLVILEAMQHGLPVIASAVGAVPEIIEDNVSGILFEPGNIKELHDKLELLGKDPDLRVELGKKALNRYEERYTWKHFAEGMQKIFREILFPEPPA